MATQSINVADLNGENGFALIGAERRDFSGIFVSSAGDVNGDGFDDVIISDRYGHSSSSSSSYVVFGKASGFDAVMNLSALNGSNGFRMEGTHGDALGRSVSNAGDINGDGFDDVIISAASAYNSASYVVFGKSSGFDITMNLSDLDGSNGFRLDGSGFLVSGAGDVNGDGFDDVMVSSGLRHHVVFGKASGFDCREQINCPGL